MRNKAIVVDVFVLKDSLFAVVFVAVFELGVFEKADWR